MTTLKKEALMLLFPLLFGIQDSTKQLRFRQESLESAEWKMALERAIFSSGDIESKRGSQAPVETRLIPTCESAARCVP